MPAEFGQLVIIPRLAAVGRSLTRSKANHAGLDTAFRVPKKCASETPGLIVGMRGDAHQSQHGLIVADVQRFAETEQLFS